MLKFKWAVLMTIITPANQKINQKTKNTQFKICKIQKIQIKFFKIFNYNHKEAKKKINKKSKKKELLKKNKKKLE